ncbi:hypothetical protein BXY82_1790 [Gelidibacter sediminis]|uniref:Uncharacterized protein n=1 Tax=Gelidibacter sediminis TaxID=1608710 RepID=A0A4R7Q035_9FLAO|nr:hypothetical protein [Gelidibacter sediminis]TDU39760.1 hypothetical protein BXY82_1790 [Gelidibacter sediminis]
MIPPKNTQSTAPKKSSLNLKTTDLPSDSDAIIPTQDATPEPIAKDRSFGERWKTHRFWLVRVSYHVLFSVWAIVMAIGGIIAWIIAMLFI